MATGLSALMVASMVVGSDGRMGICHCLLYDINFSPMDGLAPCGAVDMGGFPMVRIAAESGMAAESGGG